MSIWVLCLYWSNCTWTLKEIKFLIKFKSSAICTDTARTGLSVSLHTRGAWRQQLSLPAVCEGLWSRSKKWGGTVVSLEEHTGLRVDGRTQRGLGTAATHSVTGLCLTKVCLRSHLQTELSKEEPCVKSFLFCPVWSIYLEEVVLKELTS